MLERADDDTDDTATTAVGAPTRPGPAPPERPNIVNQMLGKARIVIQIGVLHGSVRAYQSIQVVILVLLIVELLGTGTQLWRGFSGVDTPAAASSRDLVGDPRTADPCQLTEAGALSHAGEVEQRRDYGGFARCDALVYLSPDHQNYVDVIVQFTTRARNPAIPVEQRDGGVGLQRPPADSDGCERVLLLPGDVQLSIAAQPRGQAVVDACGMADAVTSAALVELDRGQIRRRDPPLPPESLASRDACAVLDAASVTAATGARLTPRPAFGNWACDWTAPDDRRRVRVVFDQNTTGTGVLADGTPARVGRFDGRVLPPDSGDPDCDVALVYRTYPVPSGERTAELALIKVDGDQPSDQLCATARHLADTAARRLAS